MKKPSIRRRMAAGHAALEACGIKPCAVSILPDDSIRFELVPQADDVERDIEAFEAKHARKS